MSDAPEFHQVVIVGTGFAGLGQALALARTGVDDVVLLEKAPASTGVGGTWRDNTYPGCACDIPSHMYSLSTDLNPSWSRSYSPQPEIREYLERLADRHDLRRLVRFATEMTGATWDEESRTWTVHTDPGRVPLPVPDLRGRRPAPALDAVPAGRRALPRPGVPLGAVAPRRRPARQAGRGRRHRGERRPVRPADRAGRRRGDDLPAHAPVGAPQGRPPDRRAAPEALRPGARRPAGLPRRALRRPGVPCRRVHEPPGAAAPGRVARPQAHRARDLRPGARREAHPALLAGLQARAGLERLLPRARPPHRRRRRLGDRGGHRDRRGGPGRRRAPRRRDRLRHRLPRHRRLRRPRVHRARRPHAARDLA